MTLKRYDELEKRPLPPRGSEDWAEAQREYIYVIAHPHGYFKVGRSGNPERRVRSIQTGSPYELRLLLKAEFEDAQGVEKRIHRLLSEYNIRREWFELPADVQDKLIEWVRGSSSLVEFPDPTDGEEPTVSDIRERNMKEMAFR